MSLVLFLHFKLELVHPVPENRRRDLQYVEESPEPPGHLLFLVLIRHEAAQVHDQVCDSVHGEVHQGVLGDPLQTRGENVDRQIHARHPGHFLSRELQVFERVCFADCVQVQENVLDDEGEQTGHGLDEVLQVQFPLFLGDDFVDLGEAAVRRSSGSC